MQIMLHLKERCEQRKSRHCGIISLHNKCLSCGIKRSWTVSDASYVVSEMFAKMLRPYSEGEFVKKCVVATATCSRKTEIVSEP